MKSLALLINIDDFLKELNLTEGRGTGIPKIRRHLRNNRSPEAVFETDEERTYFLVTFKPHPEFSTQPLIIDTNRHEQIGTGLSWDQVGTKLGLSSEQAKILYHCADEKGIKELMQLVDRQNRTKFRNRVLKPLLREALIELTIPDIPKSPNQKYRLTDKGRKKTEKLKED